MEKSVKKEDMVSARERLLDLVDNGSVNVEDALLACVRAMSEDTCEWVLNNMNTEAVPEEGEVEADVEIAAADEPAPEVVVDEVPAEDDMEECNRRELEARIEELEKMVKAKEENELRARRMEAIRHHRLSKK